MNDVTIEQVDPFVHQGHVGTCATQPCKCSFVAAVVGAVWTVCLYTACITIAFTLENTCESELPKKFLWIPPLVDVGMVVIIGLFLLCEHVPMLFISAFLVGHFVLFCMGLGLLVNELDCMSYAYRLFTWLLFITQTAWFGVACYGAFRMERR